MKKLTIADKLPFFKFEDHTMVYKDGSLGVGFTLKGFDAHCASVDAINSFCQKVESLIIGLGPNLRLQVFYKLTGDADEVIERHLEASKRCESSYMPIRKSREEFLKKKLEGDEFFVPQIHFFLRGEPLNFKRSKLFEKKSQSIVFPEKEFELHKERFYTLVAQVEEALRSCGLGPTRLLKSDWFDLCFSHLNFDRSENVGTATLRDDRDPLSPSLGEQLGLTNISVFKQHLEIGSLKFRSISMGLLPEGETQSSMIESLLGLPFHFWLSQSIKTLDQKTQIEKLELMRRVANSMVSGSQNVSDIESESKLSSLEDLLRDLMNGSEKLVSSDMTVTIWGKSNDELELKTEEVLRAFRSMGQAEGLVETFALEDAFFKSVPSVCEGFRHKKMKSSNCAHLMPLFSSWMGSKRPVVMLSNREGAPFSIDPFAKELPNWNGLIFGGSGAGKSFSISQLMLHFCGQDPKPKIVWIDNGASSEKLVEVMDGEFLDLHLKSGVCLNMFDLEHGETQPSSAKIKLILGCLELVLKDEDKPGLPKRDKGLLEEAIFDCYESVKGRVPRLSDLKSLLSSHPVPEMKKYADILYSWTGDTAYGRMLDGDTNVKLSKDLVSIEVKGLENYRELKDILLLLLTSHIKDEAASDLSRPYLLICDEAQRLFKGSAMGREFAIDCFRVFRKYNAGIWCISQNYKDFLSDPDLADSLMPNTTFLFILRQRKISWEDFKTTFDFNDAQVEAVKSLDIVKGKYSEFFLLQDEDQAVVRLEPEPLSYWICTTDGADKSKVAAMKGNDPDHSLIGILSELSKGGINQPA